MNKKELLKNINLLQILFILYLILSVNIFIKFNIIVEGEKGLGGLLFIVFLIPGLLALFINMILNKIAIRQLLLISLRLFLFIPFFLFWLYSIKSLFFY